MLEESSLAPTNRPPTGTFLEVLGVFLKLGLTSFGGPVAHLGYFRSEIVQRRQWVDEQTYGDLLGLSQFLPGPASSQTVVALGISRAGLWGGLAAWLGFTLPSAFLLILFAYGVTSLNLGNSATAWLHGLKIVAVAVVAQAVWSMAKNFCPDARRAFLAVGAAILMLLLPFSFMQILIIGLAALVGWRFLPGEAQKGSLAVRFLVPRSLATGCLVLFFLLLFLLPLARSLSDNRGIGMFDSFYRSGALVFGGGHVVLPLLQSEVVPAGWASTEQFISGYGAAQAVPGPLFTFAAYLGTVGWPAPNSWLGGLLALGAIFLPGVLLMVGALPFWDALRTRSDFQAVLRGVNAAVVGILLAALYNPVWTSAILNAKDFALALADFFLLTVWKWSPWVIVIFSAVGAALLSLV